MSIFLELPEFSPDGFINRHQEIAEVRAVLMRLLQGELVDKRTFIYTGQHGIGKTWFLLRLREEFSAIKDVTITYVDLNHYLDLTPPVVAITQICSAMGRQLSSELQLPQASLENTVRALIQAIKQRTSSDQVFVLLLDTVYEAPVTLLAALENYLLGPLAIDRNVLLVMAGRGREYAWTAPELRLRAEFKTLNTFDKPHVVEQLTFHAPTQAGNADEIFRMSLGNPKATLLVATNPDPLAALDQIIDDMLPLGDSATRRLIREHLEALAVPRRFDYSHVPRLWSAYYNDSSYQQLSRREIRAIFDRLLHPGLIYWNDKQLAYTLHTTMRHLLLQSLRGHRTDLRHRLQTSCIELYQGWVQDKPRNWEQWQAELEHHVQELSAN
jgi:hypothetical protein